MGATRTAQEVYDKLIARFGHDADGDPNAIALFTYALVERDKYDWFAHHRAEHGGDSPTVEQVEQWYASKPDSYFDDRYEKAFEWYKTFARVLLKDEIQEERRLAISEYVGDKMSFVPQLLVSLASNVVFTFLIGAVAVYVFADFSPIAWVKQHIVGK